MPRSTGPSSNTSIRVMVVAIMTFSRTLPIIILVGFAACRPPPPAEPEPERSGSTLLLDFRPVTRPPMVGAFDFKLLGGGVGKACVVRGTTTQAYWVGMDELAKLDSDRLTQQAIAAAAHDAISRLEDADSIVITRVVTEGKGSDKVCASIYGRGVQLTKAAEPTPTVQPGTPSTTLPATSHSTLGSLTIDSEPFAKIFVDGVPFGDTPLFEKAIPAGKHTIRAVLKDGRQRTLEIDVAPGSKFNSGKLTW